MSQLRLIEAFFKESATGEVAQLKKVERNLATLELVRSRTRIEIPSSRLAQAWRIASFEEVATARAGSSD